MASAGVRAYNGGLEAEPPAGVQGQSPRWGSGEQSPLKPMRFFVFKTVIFNASATVFARNDVLFVLFELLLLLSK